MEDARPFNMERLKGVARFRVDECRCKRTFWEGMPSVYMVFYFLGPITKPGVSATRG
jgi:hypothetical protein